MFVDEVKYFSLKYAWKKRLFHRFVTRIYLTACSFHITCTFQSESTLHRCLNFKEIFAWNRCDIYLNLRLRTIWLWIGILLQPLALIFDNIFGPKVEWPFLSCICFPQMYAYWHLKIYTLFYKWGLKHFMNIPV